MHTDPLSSRLRNCLVTILEFEEELEQAHLGSALQNEFTVLKQVVKHLEKVQVEEHEVCRIEAATGRFLAELKETLNNTPAATVQQGRLLH